MHGKARFKDAVLATPSIRGAFTNGLQALKSSHRGCLELKRGASWRGSVDLDSALEDALPNEPRWDYLVGFGRNHDPDRLTCVEVHPAHTGKVDEVLRKNAWLDSWLDSSAPALKALPRAGYYWIPTAGTHIQPGSPQERRLAASGIRIKTRVILSPD